MSTDGTRTAGGYSEARLVGYESRTNVAGYIASGLAGVLIGLFVMCCLGLAIAWLNDGRLWGGSREVVEDVVETGYHDSGKFVTSEKFVKGLETERRERTRDLMGIREDIHELTQHCERTRCTCHGRGVPPPPGSGVGSPVGAKPSN